MDSTPTIDPEGAVELGTTVSEGPPLPNFLISEIRAREGAEDVTITTTEMKVRLKSAGTGSNDPNETTFALPLPVDPIQTPYPGITLNPR